MIKKDIKNKEETKKNKTKIIEGFHTDGGTVPRVKNIAKSDGKNLDDYKNGVSATTQMFCKQAADPLYKTKKLEVKTTSQRKRLGIYPDKEQTMSEFTEFNPFFYMLIFVNFFIQILEEFLGIFKWLFSEAFEAMSDLMIPKNFSGKFGLHPGTKYCINKVYWRFFLTMLCPPAGVFMAYGMSGWIQIIICCVLSLLYYIPGLIYAIIVMNRSDVAESLENSIFGSCDGSSKSFFISDPDNTVNCTRVAGDKCHAGPGKALPGDPTSSSCCVQPIYDSAEQKWKRGTEVALDSEGKPINSYEEGELMCKVLEFNYLPNSDKGGVCVFKSTGRPGI
jgi:uncharacterized membrane protein YqaE (UPF0057 family)